MINELSSLADDQVKTFALMCVENVALVFRRLGRRESVEVFDSLLNTMWAATPARPSDIVAIRKTVRCLDEANAEDSKTPKYYAMIALSVLDDAIEAHQQVRPLPAAESAATGAINLSRNFDVIIRSDGPRRLIGGKMLPPGPLEQAQTNAQREAILCLRNTVRIAAELREVAAKVGSELGHSLSAVAEKKKWIIREG